MYAEVTESLQCMGFRWKGSSFEALGPSTVVLRLPTVGTVPGRDVACKPQLRWLGRVLCYESGWEGSYAWALSLGPCSH